MKTALAWSEPVQQKGGSNHPKSIPEKAWYREAILVETLCHRHRSGLPVSGGFWPEAQHALSTGSTRPRNARAAHPYCDAIEAVRQYLQAGGTRAPDPDRNAPCPICGSKTYRDHNWDGKYTKTLGWRCAKGGLRHFLEAKAERIQQQLAENPWLIPPAPGYPGVRRDEVMTWEECEAINRKCFSKPATTRPHELHNPNGGDRSPPGVVCPLLFHRRQTMNEITTFPYYRNPKGNLLTTCRD